MNERRDAGVGVEKELQRKRDEGKKEMPDRDVCPHMHLIVS